MAPDNPATRSVFRRAETSVAHAVYGVILALATVGELLNHGAETAESIAWLLGAGLVLLIAHLFSEVIARVASTRRTLRRSDLARIGIEDLAVLPGFLASAGLVVIAGLAGIRPGAALGLAAALGLVSLASLAFYASAGRSLHVRVFMTLGAAVVGAVIVSLEQAV